MVLPYRKHPRVGIRWIWQAPRGVLAMHIQVSFPCKTINLPSRPQQRSIRLHRYHFPSMTPQNSSPLLILPIEIRSQIYTILFTDLDPHWPKSKSIPWSKVSLYGPSPAILRTCKQLNREALLFFIPAKKVFFDSNVIYITSDSDEEDEDEVEDEEEVDVIVRSSGGDWILEGEGVYVGGLVASRSRLFGRAGE